MQAEQSRTVGISPKVQALIAALGGPGLILLILGLILGDDTLTTAGITAICGAAVGGGASYAASPGTVVTTTKEIAHGNSPAA